jgi:uncharacterized protein
MPSTHKKQKLLYRSFSDYLAERYEAQKVRKIAVNAGMTCPNRDGKLSFQGCLYCDENGSGSGSLLTPAEQVQKQIGQQAAKGINAFFVYFQSFTNTYAEAADLKKIWDSALMDHRIVGLCIGTRPDCVDREIMDLIASYTDKYEVWLEYGLQSSNDATLQRMNRGHSVSDLDKAVQLTRGHGIKICIHMILGLPGESREDMLATARYIASLSVDGIKIHGLYIRKNTRLHGLYRNEPFPLMTAEEYAEVCADVLELLPPEMVIQRLTSDCPAELLVGPEWISRKSDVTGLISRKLDTRGSKQGFRYKRPVKK